MTFYRSISSLGSWCACAHQLRRSGLITVPTPFDWTFTPVDAVQHLIRTDFSGYFQRRSLVVNNGGQNVKDVDSGLLIQHYFRRNELGKVDEDGIGQDYEGLVEPFRRKVQRFRALLNSPGPCLYVLMTESKWARPRPTREAIVALRDTMRSCYPRHEFDLLVLRFEKEREPDWDESGLIQRYVATVGNPSNGDDASWDRVLREFSVCRIDPSTMEGARDIADRIADQRLLHARAPYHEPRP